MQETRKKILGFSGLALVTGMTFIASNIQVPGALAVSGSIAEQLMVRVVGAEPSLRITTPESGAIFTDPTGVSLKYTYENAVNTSLVYTYIDPAGQEIFRNRILESLDSLDYNAGESEVPLEFASGYGTYIYTLKGVGFDEVQAASDSIVVKYQLPEPEDDGDEDETPEDEPGISDSGVVIDLGNSTDVDDDSIYSYVVEVKNPDGETVYKVTVKPGTGSFVLPLEGLDSPEDGSNYTIVVTPLDINGDEVTTVDPTEIPMDPDSVADPSSPEINNDGSITVDLGVEPSNVDEVSIRVTDPKDSNFDYTVVIPTTNPSGSDTISVTLINNKTGETKQVEVPAPDPETGKITIPFDEMGATSGTDYELSITTRKDGHNLFTTVSSLQYPVILPIPDAGAPDTGALFENLNISKEDYLISGLLFFFVIGAVAIGMIVKRGKSSAKSYKRSR